MLARLRLIGFGLALEHFGAGVSSVSDLYQTPFSELKIDAQIVTRLPHDEDAMRLARGMIALGRELGLSVTGEAVETSEALDALHSAGCERAQGYVISRPLPAGDFQALVTDWNARRAS